MISKFALPLLLALYGHACSSTTDAPGKISILIAGEKGYIVAGSNSDYTVSSGETRTQIVGEGMSGWIAANSSGPATIKLSLSFASDTDEDNFKAKVKQGGHILRLTITEDSESASGNSMRFTARVGDARVSKVNFDKGSDHSGSLTFTCARMDVSKVAAPSN